MNGDSPIDLPGGRFVVVGQKGFWFGSFRENLFDRLFVKWRGCSVCNAIEFGMGIGRSRMVGR